MSASDFTQGQQIPRKKHSLREGGLKCVWELAWIDADLTGTLNRLEHQRASKYTQLSFILSEGLGAEKGNPASTKIRGSFTVDLDGDFTPHS